VRVFTAADLDVGAFRAPFLDLDPARDRPLMASETVRFVGDIVAAVLADSRAASVDAAELVDVDYDPIEAVVDAQEALEDRVCVLPQAGTNVCMRLGAESSGPALFEDCEVVISGRMVSQRMAPSPSSLAPRSHRLARTGG